MSSLRVANRYSKALLEIALENNNLEQVKADAVDVINAIENSRELKNFLASPIVEPAKKETTLAEIFAGKVLPETGKFIALLVKHNRENLMLQVFKAFVSQYQEHNNIVEANFKTATEVPATTVSALKSKLEQATGKTIEISTQVNPDLIGGFMVDMNNYRLDASVAGGINKIKRELIK